MKLIRFTIAGSPNAFFGVVIRDQAIPFSVLQSKSGKSFMQLADSRSYLANLPDSEGAAYEFLWSGDMSVDQERGPLAGRVSGEYSNTNMSIFALNLSWKF